MCKIRFQLPLLLLLAGGMLLSSCDELGLSRKGTIQIYFPDEVISGTRASGSATDVGDYILTVTDSKGGVVYSGSYAAAPESMSVGAGTYTVSARSCEFAAPAFDKPQYGDDKVVTVKSGETVSVELECTLLNAGVRLSIAPSFLTDYPDGVLYVKAAEGRLMYSYSEKRIAYVKPGSVSLVMSSSGSEKTLLTRTLPAREILVLNITTAGGSHGQGGGIHVTVDTTRNYVTEDYVIGGSNGGGDASHALSVAQARNHVGEKGVWVYGYIVGGDLSSTKCSFEPPFKSRTNLAIAAKSSCTDKDACLSVQLAQGSIRDDINLVDHEDYLGSLIYLKGDIVESYFGITGIQNLSDYKWK